MSNNDIHKVHEVMNSNVFSVRDDQTIQDVLYTLTHNHVSSIPVIDQENHVVAFISDGDIMKFIAKHKPGSPDMPAITPAWDDLSSLGPALKNSLSLNVLAVASKNVQTVNADDDLDEAARTLAKKAIKKAPVLRDGCLVGILSRADIAAYLFNRHLANTAE